MADDLEWRKPAALGALLKGDLKNFLVAATPGGIERQEAEGQRDLVNAEVTRLPREVVVPPQRGPRLENVYAQSGIEVIGDYDDLFVNVKLPAGWKLVATEHPMHSRLLDERGRERAAVFYKAAFYERRAIIAFGPRFVVKVEPEDAYRTDASLAERDEMKEYGRVYEGELVIFATAGVLPLPGEDWQGGDARRKTWQAECANWLAGHGYADYSDPFKYW